MGWARMRMAMIAAVVALVAASCGGGDEGATDATESSGESSTSQGEAATSPPSTESPEQETDAPADEAPGERSAVITIDGESTTYDLDDVTFSSVEGVDDLTFETCDPDFFGSGRFYAIGYAVDADGELIVGDDDQPGTFSMDLPPDDWEETERDAPNFEIELGDIDIEIATPEEAANGTMAWAIEDTRASGTAVFVDFENTYTVDFEVICEGSPTVAVENLPSDDDDTAGEGGGGGGLPPAGGVGSFTVEGESFDNVDVYSCEPFSFGSDPDPRDLSVLAYLGGSDGLEVEVSHSQGVEVSDEGQTRFDQINLSVFYSRAGEAGLEQFEGSADSAADGTWFTGDQVPLDANPVVIDGDRITGSLAGLDQIWPDEGAATVDVTWDFEIPSEVLEDC